MRHRPARALTASLLALCAWACDAADAGPASADDWHAVILLYHHVGDDTPPSTSVTPQLFEAHLNHLQNRGYRVVPLSRIIAALTGEDPVPARAVAITFDDAHRSVLTEAAPRLERRGWPYAVFVSTDYLDRNLAGYLSWDELRALEARGAEIGNHSRRHAHYVHRPPEESEAAWRRRISADVRAAQARLDAELRHPLAALAYPYGEFTPELAALTRELGFVAFGQHSGPVGPGSPLAALPRFPMAGPYAALDSLAEKLRTRPFSVRVVTGADPVLPHDARAAPALRLALAAPDANLPALSCFVGGQPPPRVTWLDADAGLVEIQARHPLPVGRSKYTCTAPARAGGGTFYWYSHLWMRPPAPGGWYED